MSEIGDVSPTVLSAKILGFDSEVFPMRFLSLGMTVMFALTLLRSLETSIGPVI